jgi:hypothetical protein
MRQAVRGEVMRRSIGSLGAAAAVVLAFGAATVSAETPSGTRTLGQAVGQSRHITLKIGDAFVVAGTNLACAAQIGQHVIRGQKLVTCFLVKGGTLAANSYVAALGANGRVAVGHVNAKSNIDVSVFDRKPAGLGSRSRQITVRAGDELLLSGTDIACGINNDASGIYPTCFRVTPRGGLPGSYGFAETKAFVAVVQFDSTGKKTRVLLKRAQGH